jgi:hypothetical protein
MRMGSGILAPRTPPATPAGPAAPATPATPAFASVRLSPLTLRPLPLPGLRILNLHQVTARGSLAAGWHALLPLQPIEPPVSLSSAVLLLLWTIHSVLASPHCTNRVRLAKMGLCMPAPVVIPCLRRSPPFCNQPPSSSSRQTLGGMKRDGWVGRDGWDGRDDGDGRASEGSEDSNSKQARRQ